MGAVSSTIIAAAHELGLDENGNVIGMGEGAKADASGFDPDPESESESAGLLKDRLLAAWRSGNARDVLTLLVEGKTA